MSKPRITLCMIVMDEEALLPECLASARGVVDAIVIGVDTRTRDNTADIARTYGAQVVPSVWQDDFSLARNEVLNQCSEWGGWILHLDADERLTNVGRALIRKPTEDVDAAYDGVSLKVEHRSQDGYVFYGADYKTRLFRSHLRYRNVAHEVVECSYLARVETNSALIRHIGYDPVLFKQREKLQRNKFLLEKWVDQEPDNPLANYYMARFWIAVGDPKRARPYVSAALDRRERLMPNQVELLEKVAAESV